MEKAHRAKKTRPRYTHATKSDLPYFARRKLTPAFRKLAESGKLRGGTDSTEIISEGREDRYS